MDVAKWEDRILELDRDIDRARASRHHCQHLDLPGCRSAEFCWDGKCQYLTLIPGR